MTRLIDDGFLDETPPRRRRFGCAWLALLLLAAVLAGAPVAAVQSATATPRGAPDGAITSAAVLPVVRPALLGAPSSPLATGEYAAAFGQPDAGSSTLLGGAPNLPVPSLSGVGGLGGRFSVALAGGGEPAPPTAPAAEAGVGTALMAGNIGWAEPDLGIDYLATRFPVGTLVEICGPNACLIRRTNDYGPVASIRPNRIADLAVLDWEYICGLPRTRGLCPGTVETVAEIALPQTDTAP